MDVRVCFSAMEWESIGTGARGKRVEIGGKTLRLLEFTDGFVEPEWCLRGHWGMVLEGELRLRVDGAEVVYSQGDGIALPGGQATRHRHLSAHSPTLLFLVEEIDR
ncbi:MAG: cupin domain-containing protein [Armatimonadetes bacterium]|nr:cupin domain-containing protein [Armatimonadota bacterium]